MSQIALIIFVLGAAMLFSSVFVYSKANDTDGTKTLRMISELKAKQTEMESLLLSNIETVGNNNVKVDGVLKLVETVKAYCLEMEHEIDSVQLHCDKIREGQIKLQDQLSNKRPVIKIQNPIPVQVVDNIKTSTTLVKPLGQGIKAIIKNNKAKSK